MMVMALGVTLDRGRRPAVPRPDWTICGRAERRTTSRRDCSARGWRRSAVGHGWRAVHADADGRYSYAVYLDGNRNGVLTRDIQRGVDRPIAAAEQSAGSVPGRRVRRGSGTAAVDAGGTAPGTDPIRLGSGSIASFSALGTASSGTVYIRGRRDAQYAVRIFGETGKTRMLKFEPRTGKWKQL